MRKPALLLLASIGLYAIGDAILAPAPSPEHPGVGPVQVSDDVVVVDAERERFASELAQAMALIDKLRQELSEVEEEVDLLSETEKG